MSSQISSTVIIEPPEMALKYLNYSKKLMKNSNKKQTSPKWVPGNGPCTTPRELACTFTKWYAGYLHWGVLLEEERWPIFRKESEGRKGNQENLWDESMEDKRGAAPIQQCADVSARVWDEGDRNRGRTHVFRLLPSRSGDRWWTATRVCYVSTSMCTDLNPWRLMET